MAVEAAFFGLLLLALLYVTASRLDPDGFGEDSPGLDAIRREHAPDGGSPYTIHRKDGG